MEFFFYLNWIFFQQFFSLSHVLHPLQIYKNEGNANAVDVCVILKAPFFHFCSSSFTTVVVFVFLHYGMMFQMGVLP